MDLRFRCSKNYCKKSQDVENFRPSRTELKTRKRDAFDKVLKEIWDFGVSDDRIDRLGKVRTKVCKHCRDANKRSLNNPNTKRGQCKVFWESIRNQPCNDCGKERGTSQADHQCHKVKELSNYAWWSSNGGVDAMKEEFAKCVVRCNECHAKQPSHNIFQRNFPTWQEMPDNTPKQKQAKHHRRYRDEKYAYVNAKKHEIGQCEECGFDDFKGFEHVMEFAHKNASIKRDSNDSVSRVCSNRISFKTAKPKLDRLFIECRLLCSTCHTLETRQRNNI